MRLIKEINDSCEKIDKENPQLIDRFTHEMIFAINKWRTKNKLRIYKEEPIELDEQPTTYELDGVTFVERKNYENAFLRKMVTENPDWFKVDIVLKEFNVTGDLCPKCKSKNNIRHFLETSAGWTLYLCLGCKCRY